MRKILLALSLLGTLFLADHAKAACPVPNPNLLAGNIVNGIAQGFFDGCPVPAAALNNMLFRGGQVTNYTPFSIQQTWGTGVRAPSSIDSSVSPLVQFAITSNTASTPGSGSAPLALLNEYGGNADTSNCTLSVACSHFGLWVNLYKNGTTVGADFASGIFSNVTATAAAPGYESVPGAYSQSLYGYSGQVSDAGGDYYGVVGAEADINLQVNSDNIKEGWAVASAPLAGKNDLYQGLNYSAGYGLWAAGSCGAGTLAGGSGCAGFTTGISFGRSDSYFPINQFGTMIGITQGVGALNKIQSNYGIDFSLGTFGFCSIRVPGICLDAAGNLDQTLATPTQTYKDTAVATPATHGGYMRLISLSQSTNSWSWQINTASAGDFSTGVTPLAIGIGTGGAGAVSLTGLVTVTPSGAGSASKYVCTDSSNNIVVQSGAC
jgi:hypothetical protein